MGKVYKQMGTLSIFENEKTSNSTHHTQIQGSFEKSEIFIDFLKTPIYQEGGSNGCDVDTVEIPWDDEFVTLLATHLWWQHTEN